MATQQDSRATEGGKNLPTAHREGDEVCPPPEKEGTPQKQQKLWLTQTGWSPRFSSFLAEFTQESHVLSATRSSPQTEAAQGGTLSVKRRRVDFAIGGQHSRAILNGNNCVNRVTRGGWGGATLCRYWVLFFIDSDSDDSEDVALAEMAQGVSALSGLITSGAEDQSVEPLVTSEWILLFVSPFLWVSGSFWVRVFLGCVLFVGLHGLVFRMEASLDKAALSGQRVRKYSSRHHLRKDMVGDHIVLSVFVSGSSTGVATRFHCMICRRDVSMQSRGTKEFTRHYSSDRHWERDVAYRDQNDMPTYDRQMEPMNLSTGHRDEYMSREKIAKDEGFSFPEDFLSSCTRVDLLFLCWQWWIVSLNCVVLVVAMCCCGNCGAISGLPLDAKIPYTIFIGIAPKL